MASTPPSRDKLALDDAKGRWRLLKDSFRLEEALDDLGINVVKEQADGELLSRCILPSHGGADNNPSFILNRYTFKFHCRSCNGGGQIPKLVMELRGLTMVEALDWLCQYTDQRNPMGLAFANRIKTILATPIGDDPIPAKHPVLPWLPMSALVKFDHPTDYFTSRGISPEACQTLHLGFDPQHSRSDYYVGPAAIIPHIFRGELVGWQERWLEWQSGWAGPAKYTNTNDFPKQESLYNYDRVADNPSAVVVVESAMTVAKLLTAGIPAVATFGSSVTPQQLRLLKRLRQGLILAFDNDVAGELATREVGEATTPHVPVVVLPPPPGEKADLGDLTVDEIHAKMPHTKPYILWRSGL